MTIFQALKVYNEVPHLELTMSFDPLSWPFNHGAHREQRRHKLGLTNRDL